MSLWQCFLAFYLVCQDKHGISTTQLASQLGTTYKTAWYMLKRIRTAMGQRDKKRQLSGEIEFDDVHYIRQDSVKSFAEAAFADDSTICSDGYRSYTPGLKAYRHQHKVYDPNSGMLHWLHIIVSNAKVFILGTYHGRSRENLQSYLDEFAFRFNRRSFGPAILDRLAVAVASSAMLI